MEGVCMRALVYRGQGNVSVDVRCDPDVPPVPPYATFDQAKSLVKAVLGGDEDSAGFIKQGIKQKVQQYLPGEKKP
jgi:pyruvate dehydrogenase (quinone)